MAQEVDYGHKPQMPAAQRVLPWAMLSVVLLVQTTYQGATQAGGPLAPFIQADLHITRAQVGLFGSAVAAGLLLTVIPAGWLADRRGSHLLLSASPLWIGLFLFAASRAPSFELMVALVCIGALGVGFVIIGATKAVVSWFTPRSRGMAMGIKQTGTAWGGAIGAAVLPALAIGNGWRYSLAAAGIMVAAAGLVALVAYRDFDRVPRDSSPRQSYSLWHVVAQRNVALVSAASFFFGIVQMSSTAYLALYFVEVRGMAATAAGSLLALANIAGVTARILLGTASDRLFAGRRRGPLLFTGCGSLASALALAAWGGTLPFGALAALIAFFGLTGLGSAGMLVVMSAEAPEKQASGTGAALGFVGANTGALVGPPLFGLLVDYTDSYAYSWLALALASVLGILVLLPVRELRKE